MNDFKLPQPAPRPQSFFDGLIALAHGVWLRPGSAHVPRPADSTQPPSFRMRCAVGASSSAPA